MNGLALNRYRMLKLEIAVCFLAFIASLFRVTGGLVVRSRSVWPALFLLNVSLILKELVFIFLFVVTSAGVVPRVSHKVPRVSHKKRFHTSSLVQFIFYYWSFQISRNIQRKSKSILGLDSYILNSFSYMGPF